LGLGNPIMVCVKIYHKSYTTWDMSNIALRKEFALIFIFRYQLLVHCLHDPLISRPLDSVHHKRSKTADPESTVENTEPF